MAARVPAGLTASEGRRFGGTVGGVFLLLGLVAYWRAHPAMAALLAAIGAGLVAAGAIIPARLGPVERAWMRLAQAISKITTPIVMGVMFLLVITPAAVLRRALGGTPLRHVQQGEGFWIARAEGSRKSADMRRQF